MTKYSAPQAVGRQKGTGWGYAGMGDGAEGKEPCSAFEAVELHPAHEGGL